ncbi:MAG: Stf0 family sulfotransferase [Solirubrobacterales bacterium]
MKPTRSYLVCSTPRSGSTLVCKALRDTGVAGRPEEYFEALRSTGRPRRPEEYFAGVDDRSIFDELGEPEDGGAPPPAWSRTAYDRYLDWAKEQGTTDNGVFGAKLMWQYLGDFVGLLRGVPEYRDLPLSELLPAAFPDLTFVRVVRANKIRQAVSLWKAVQTASWSDRGGEAPTEEGYRAFLEEHKPQLRFHYKAISHLLDQTLAAEASWDAFFEHTRIKPILVLYENFYADYATSTLNILDRLGLEPSPDFDPEPQMRRQSDGINDDWARRFSELRLGTEFDLVPAGNAG